MGVMQIAFEIPKEIQKGLDAGTLTRFGGVVRDTAGHIVTHLKEAPKSKANSAFKQVEEFVKNNKNPIILISVAVTAMATAGITYVIFKNKNNENVKIPKCVADFNRAFSNYINAIKESELDEKDVDTLLNSIDTLKKNEKSGKVTITISVENADLLINMIKTFTEEFAKANSYIITNAESDKTDKIGALQHYLNIQKQVFKKCA